jgi:hypothetical protein
MDKHLIQHTYKKERLAPFESDGSTKQLGVAIFSHYDGWRELDRLTGEVGLRSWVLPFKSMA